jgi:hypothetical protein
MHIITNGFEDIQYLKLENTGLAPYLKRLPPPKRPEAKSLKLRILISPFDLHRPAKAKASLSAMVFGPMLQGHVDMACPLSGLTRIKWRNPIRM